MELVLLQDVQSSYGANWARIANTQGVNEIQIKDRFREQGFGPGAEELEVAGVDISPVGGFSRLFFQRGANATQPEVHRLGAVLHKVDVPITVTGPVYWIPKPEAVPAPELPAAPVDQAASEPSPVKRGRPVGSKNKPKELATSAAGKAFGLD